MRVTSLTQPRCKITYKYLNIKILQQICLITWYKFTTFFSDKKIFLFLFSLLEKSIYKKINDIIENFIN